MWDVLNEQEDLKFECYCGGRFFEPACGGCFLHVFNIVKKELFF
jgi:hypothetical protein